MGTGRDVADERDHRFDHTGTAAAPSADLRRFCAPAYNQLAIKSCSANATAAALRMVAAITNTPVDPPSRLFAYYNARALAGTQAADNGATLRDAMKTLSQTGTCAEALWPYDPQKVNDKPPAGCYEKATIHAIRYQRIEQSLEALKGCLAQGYPFVFGLTMYVDAIEAAQTTHVLPLPGKGAQVMGGHAVVAVGYDDATGMITALNSLGPDWGAQGFFSLPYAYFPNADLTYDFWTIRTVDEGT
jgi:C1A family cysteine protease